MLIEKSSPDEWIPIEEMTLPSCLVNKVLGLEPYVISLPDINPVLILGAIVPSLREVSSLIWIDRDTQKFSERLLLNCYLCL